MDSEQLIEEISRIEFMNKTQREHFIRKVDYYETDKISTIIFVLIIGLCVGYIGSKLYQKLYPDFSNNQANSESSIDKNGYSSPESLKIEIVETINSYIDTEKTCEFVSSIEILLYIIVSMSFILYILYTTDRVLVFALILVPIFYVFIDGPVKTKLKRLEIKGNKLIEMSMEEDEDKIFLQTLDPHLKRGKFIL